MRTQATQSIRTLLRENPDGMDVGTLANRLNREPNSIRGRLKLMPDVYIDRWERHGGNPPLAIWCVVVPPENCPKPATKKEKLK
jgi:hypothetical protein